MVYDFVVSQDSVAGKTVLLVATPKKYIEAVEAACETSKLTPVAITSSALVLGEATGKSASPGALVLAVSPGGAELTARQNGAPSAVRYVRGPEQSAPFVSAVAGRSRHCRPGLAVARSCYGIKLELTRLRWASSLE